ncbi:carbohydrate kinase [Mucilaginibacter sp. Bleaf8]|uniref:carbohydrate kinase family protein n=1 Tax=Mucilaginibacter sp. Bleaf8 TaxID=2834430 RepID=UPI001BCFBE10|nr:carbohydrate kinase [Mucilaginibacter sp. Bleaf8]MBS7564330.1 carbohydrate kinase [Mucilaginibacter sp. Bleaf8]
MSKQVLCFGEVLWDTFSDGKKVGGAPLNVAQHLRQQGVNALMVSRIGTDASGNELMAFLQQHQLNTPLIQVDNRLATCEVTVQLNDAGHATYVIPEPVSWDNIQPDQELLMQAAQSSAIVFGSLACRNQATRTTLLDLLSEITVPLRIFDVNLRAPHYEMDTIETLAAMANVIKMNEDEADLLIGSSKRSLQEKITEFQHKFHVNTICVTRGENGAMIWHDEQFYEHPGFPTEVADTVGAGDSFLATLVAGLLTGQPIDATLEKACKVGAFVASQRGANPTYPAELGI